MSSRAITVRVPVPEAGVVDIPIVEKEAQGQQHHHKVGGGALLEGRVFCSSLKSHLDFFGCR